MAARLACLRCRAFTYYKEAMSITIKNLSVSATLRATLGAALLVGVCSAYAATGFVVTASQETLVKVGMSRAEVRNALGRPAHNVKYRAEPGRTWTYGVLGNPEHTQAKVFDVDFSADDKVLSFGERNEPEMN
jgi:outer membrane protein assembly factor BamE (lipoprotein component of BamABCDE complex)